MLAPLLLATRLVVDTDHVQARFDPRVALGATIDVNGYRRAAKVLTPAHVETILSAGFQPLSYRLATELAAEAWHWNPTGTWSDPAHQQGYWTSAPDSADPILASYGYRLPRRGNTIDQLHDDGYSRIDDGDRTTFWKSNPYLGERPQWILVDFRTRRTVDTIRVVWAEPFATDFKIQYWVGNEAPDRPFDGNWFTFEGGEGHASAPGEMRIALGARSTRYVRVSMTTSSRGKADDWRDRVGFAVAELSVGHGQVDFIRHAPSRTQQTVIWVSSTDPWHRSSDIDRSMEQPGLDAVFRSGLTRGLPTMVPVALLYGTPDDSANEIRFLRGRRYAVEQIEMGEEPDGQNVSPEDYAALYLQWADAIHAVDPALRLGGPAFQSTRNIIPFWPDERGSTSWIGRFLGVLRARQRVEDFSFFSFEWYPFDDVCGDPHQQLIEAPSILARILSQWRAEGLPMDIPWMATEYGWSSFASAAEVDIIAALQNAEFVAEFLGQGGAAAYFYTYEIGGIGTEPRCPTYGGLMLFLGDEDAHITAKLPVYYGAQLIMREWLLPEGIHELHAVRGTSALLRAYAVRRPDGSWALLIINKSRAPRSIEFSGAVVQYSRREYAWHAAGAHGYPIRNRPPRRFHAARRIELPPESITVVVLPGITPPAR